MKTEHILRGHVVPHVPLFTCKSGDHREKRMTSERNTFLPIHHRNGYESWKPKTIQQSETSLRMTMFFYHLHHFFLAHIQYSALSTVSWPFFFLLRHANPNSSQADLISCTSTTPLRLRLAYKWTDHGVKVPRKIRCLEKESNLKPSFVYFSSFFCAKLFFRGNISLILLKCPIPAGMSRMDLVGFVYFCSSLWPWKKWLCWGWVSSCLALLAFLRR